MSESAVVYDPDQLLHRYDPHDRLNRYLQLVTEENRRFNLVSRETLRGGINALRNLAAQSLLPFEVVDTGPIRNYLDIGSGGGFPAIPILLTRTVERATLVEQRQKKASALRRILLALGLKAEIIEQPFEQARFESGFDLITLRFVKLTPRLLSAATRLLQTRGHFIYYSVPDFDVDDRIVEVNTFTYSATGRQSAGQFTVISRPE